MSVVDVEVEGRPEPQLDAVSRPYWEATKRGELLIQQCTKCSHRQFYPRPLCVRCGGEPRWLQSSGLGVVHTFTVVRANGVEPFKDWLPYAVAIVELEEGPRMMGNVIGVPVDEVAIGMPVKVAFVDLNEEVALPFWQRDESR